MGGPLFYGDTLRCHHPIDTLFVDQVLESVM